MTPSPPGLSSVRRALARGSAEAIAVWAIDMAFVPYDRGAWWAGKSLLAYARPEVVPFVLGVLAVVRGAEVGFAGVDDARPGPSPRGGAALAEAIAAAAHALSLWATFLLLTVGRPVWSALPVVDGVLFGVCTALVCAAAWWLVAVATWAATALLRMAMIAIGRSGGVARCTVGIALLQVLEAGRVQPVHEMLPALRALSALSPLRWGLEATTTALDAQLGADLPARECAHDPLRCGRRFGASFAGGTCSDSGATGLRKPIARTATYLASADASAVDALVQAAALATPADDVGTTAERTVSAAIDAATDSMSYCFGGVPRARRSLPVFLSHHADEPTQRVWHALLALDGDLALYRASRTKSALGHLTLLAGLLHAALIVACRLAHRGAERRRQTHPLPGMGISKMDRPNE